MIEKDINQMNIGQIKDYLFEMQDYVSNKLDQGIDIDDFIDKTTIFDQFESFLPDDEYPVFVITILNNFKKDIIIDNLVNTIYKSTRL